MTVTVVDAFAEHPFTGNPAAVCVLDAPAPEVWMQALAGEMNLSETAFLVPSDGAFRLRWFTPEAEVDLCGHATLASAHVLYESGRLGPAVEARFDTNSGRLTVRRTGEGVYAMDFPATPPEAATVDGVEAAFGIAPEWTGRTSQNDVFVALAHEKAVHALDPDPTAVARLGARGVIVTAPADAASDVDVVSRFFAPEVGIPEDPVTGSAHCAIGPYWAGRLGRSELRCLQASARSGRVGVRVVGDRVVLTGQAVTIHHAELTPTAHP